MERMALAAMLVLGALPAGLGLSMPAACAGLPIRSPCCPMFNGSICGQDLSRGNCVMLPASRAPPPADIMEDMRDGYPGRWFNATCQCKGNFGGVDCGECKLGFSGPDCKTPKVVMRRNLLKMSPAQRSQYWAALNHCKFKLNRKWVIITQGDLSFSSTFKYVYASYMDIFSFAHFWATKDYFSGTSEFSFANFAHMGPAFPCWHRHYLAQCERSLQECLNDPDFALCYYPWTDDPYGTLFNNHDLCTSDPTGWLDPSCVFSYWRCPCAGYTYPKSLCIMSDCECERPRIQRLPGRSFDVPNLPTRAQVFRCVNISTYYNPNAAEDFCRCLEGSHNQFHGWCGGNMGQVTIAATDPAFFCHHTFVDFVFEKAIQAWSWTPTSYPTNSIYGQGYNDFSGCLMPRILLRSSMTPCEKLGYVYGE